ncbi:hypothetical protein J3L16_10155 [Alteromonas sp. 5E99-2]|uniref:hypothetical protein n=1 Tax=Alteromonas sp. 5E99-2 TaxID=2817683 RepID=UPI001A9A2B9F|nr:hypothetical protein [Alteromonas sp. 5E99-2]MBO1256046.1 hypothetical protein [Alteromonas sp. 5E99-2]
MSVDEPNLEYFNSIKNSVFSDEYSALPHYKVTKKHFDRDGHNLLFADAKRTLESGDDLIEFPAGQKLLQANGICFAGKWVINEQSEYSGFYAANTSVPILARISVSLSGTTQKDKRAMGMAIKVFGSPQSPQHDQTLNLFLLHSLGGIKTDAVLDLEMDNEPELGSLPPFSQLLTAHRLESDLKDADALYSKEKANARFRPVSHLAKIDKNGSKVEDIHSPQWIKVKTAPTIARVDKLDFRDELDLKHYEGNQLRYQIYAAKAHNKGKSKATWEEVGYIQFTESIRSKSCDTRLHFRHPSIH